MLEDIDILYNSSMGQIQTASTVRFKNFSRTKLPIFALTFPILKKFVFGLGPRFFFLFKSKFKTFPVFEQRITQSHTRIHNLS